MRIFNYMVNIIIILVSVFFLYMTLEFPEPRNAEMPGAAFFPRITLTFILILAVVDAFLTWRGDNGSPLLGKEEQDKLRSLALTLLSIILFVYLLGKLPFILVASLIIFIQCKVLKLSWVHSLTTSLILSITVYWIFVKGFNVLL